MCTLGKAIGNIVSVLVDRVLVMVSLPSVLASVFPFQKGLVLKKIASAVISGTIPIQTGGYKNLFACVLIFTHYFSPFCRVVESVLLPQT